jgi:hypothetical protein
MSCRRLAAADFPVPAPGTDGNEPRNIYRNPDMLQIEPSPAEIQSTPAHRPTAESAVLLRFHQPVQSRKSRSRGPQHCRFRYNLSERLRPHLAAGLSSWESALPSKVSIFSRCEPGVLLGSLLLLHLFAACCSRIAAPLNGSITS